MTSELAMTDDGDAEPAADRPGLELVDLDAGARVTYWSRLGFGVRLNRLIHDSLQRSLNKLLSK